MSDKNANLGFFDRLLLQEQGKKKPRSKTASPVAPLGTSKVTPTQAPTQASPRVSDARSQFYSKSPVVTENKKR